MLSATPVNLRNRDLSISSAPGARRVRGPHESLEERVAPNRVLNEITRSLLDPTVTKPKPDRVAGRNSTRSVRRVLTLRPDFELITEILARAGRLDRPMP